LLVSGSAAWATYVGTQQSQQRWTSQNVKSGIKSIEFMTAKYVFSQYGGTPIYGFNPKNLFLKVSKQYFRDRGETQEIQNANGFTSKIYSALQFVCSNRSRSFVAYIA
jgi:hypothetical protein